MSWNPEWLLIANIDMFLRNVWALWEEYNEIIIKFEKARKEESQKYKLTLRKATRNGFPLLLNKLEVMPLPQEKECKNIKSVLKQEICDTIENCAAVLMLDDATIADWVWDPSHTEIIPAVAGRSYRAIQSSITYLEKKYKREFKLID